MSKKCCGGRHRVIGPVTAGVGGGSGSYGSLQAAHDSESATEVAFAPQAGTVANSVTGTGALSAVDDFYNGWYLVNTDTTPSNGLVCRYTRVSDYNGTTKVLTLDGPWNFVNESELTLVNPIRINLSRNVTGDLAATKSCVVNLGGFRLDGKIDQTGGALLIIENGEVRNGIQKTNLGAVECIGVKCGRRDSTIYAFLMTNGSNVGRALLKDCTFYGIVAGRRGYGGWEVINCTNRGIAETEQNCPYRPFESISGVAVVVANADVYIDSEFAGCIFYSENSLTGATAFLTIKADIKLPPPLSGAAVDVYQEPVIFFPYWASGAGTLTLTSASGSKTDYDIASQTWVFATGARSGCLSGVMIGVNFIGTFNVSDSNSSFFMGYHGQAINVALFYLQGSTPCTGTITLAGGHTFDLGDGNFARYHFMGSFTGTITDSGNAVVVSAVSVRYFHTGSLCAISGAASITCSGQMLVNYCLQYFFSTINGTLSAGTFTFSGAISIVVATASVSIVGFGNTVTGGTLTFSGAITFFLLSRGMSSATIVGVSASGCSVTVSSATIRVSGSTCGTLKLVDVTGASSTGVITSAAVTVLRGFKVYTASTLINASGASSIARAQGSIQFEDCEFGVAITILNSTSSGMTAEGPPTLNFNGCLFESTLTDLSGSGTLTWSASTLRFKNCHLDGLFTFLGTSFTTLEAFNTFFNGNSGNESIAATGTRPTTYRLWACKFVASVLDLLPEIIDEWFVVPASGTLTAGNLCVINGSKQAAAPTVTSMVDGVLLAGVAVNEPAVLVTKGMIFVDTAASQGGGVILGLDPATPTQAIAVYSDVTAGISENPGQIIGRALENTGITRSGEIYTAVNLK